MATILGPNGISFDSGNRQNMGIPFSDWDATSTNWGLNTSWQQGWITKNFSIPAKSKFSLLYRFPMRNDNTNWGGCYMQQYYQINDSGTWVSMGHTGYSIGMWTGKYTIAGHNHMASFDFTGTTSPFTIKFRHDYRTYDSGANTGASHDIGSGDSTYTGTTANWWQHLTIQGVSYP